MLKKNIDKYHSEFDNISNDQKTRIYNYLDSKRLSKNFVGKITESIKRISSIKTETIKIVLDIIPEATPRPRMGFGGHFYVKNASSNNKFLELIVKNEKDLLNLITTPCSFHVTTYQPIPKNMNLVDSVLSELGWIKPITTPDWDNFGKTYSDMIQKHLLLNDSLITDGSVSKRYSFKPRVEIIIKYKLNYDSDYNKKIIEHSKSYKEKD